MFVDDGENDDGVVDAKAISSFWEWERRGLTRLARIKVQIIYDWIVRTD